MLRKQQKDRTLGKKRKRPQDLEGETSPVKKQKDTESQNKKKKNKQKNKTSKIIKADVKEDKAFNAMVQDYKKKMASVNLSVKKAWYEDVYK